MSIRRCLMVLVACLGVSAPARAAVVSPDAPDSGLITVGLRSVGTSTVVSVPIHRNAPWIVPLPAGAKNVRLVDAAQLTALEARTAPRYFHVTRPAACDPTSSCATPHPPVEPPEPAEPRAPAVAASVPTPSPNVSRPHPDALLPLPSGCFSGDPFVPQVRIARDFPHPILPPAFFDTVPAERVAAVLASRSVPVVPGRVENLPRGTHFALVGYYPNDAVLRFEVEAPFSWPIVPAASGGPREIVVVLTAGIDGNVVPFPKALENAEPPRLYVVPTGTESPASSAAHLTHELATKGVYVHLERNSRFDVAASVRDPRVVASGVLEISEASRPRTMALLRFRTSHITDLGLSPVPVAALPRSRETATAFVREAREPENAACPGEWGACYRPPRGPWIATLWPTGQAGPGPTLPEAPFSTASGTPRDASPAQQVGASGRPSDAGAVAASAPPRTATTSSPPQPAEVPRGARGCTCDTVPVPASTEGAALAALCLVALGLRRAARSSSRRARSDAAGSVENGALRCAPPRGTP